MIEIDGSIGEGGGQIVRSSLTLSMMTHQPVHLSNIRARRKNQGLRAQHLRAVDAAARISLAEVEGAQLESTELIFSPNLIRSGRYRFDIGTAGSTSLVLQTILLPLVYAQATTNLLISGGTHVPWSPCFEYIELQWLYYLKLMGVNTTLQLIKAGFYPEGGGMISAGVHPAGKLNALNITKRGEIEAVIGISAVANLEFDIAKRQKRRAIQRLMNSPFSLDPSIIKIRTIEVPSHNKGTYFFLLTKFSSSQCCFFSLGEKGKPAEKVADVAVDSLEEFLGSEGAVDPFLVDQLLIPMCFADGVSKIRTNKLSSHITTNIKIMRAFLPVDIQIDKKSSDDILITIQNNATANFTPRS